MLQTANYTLNKPESTDVIDIANLNENFDTLDSELKKVSDKANIIQTAGGTGTAITLNNVSLVNGFTITFIIAANNNGAATTISGKALYKPGGTTAPKLIAGKAVTVWYYGTNFFIKASAEGDAIAGNVLAGKTFSNDDDTGLVGTMPNNGPSVAETINLTTGGAEYTIPAGYHSGLRKIKAVITNLIASVIKAGTTVGGVLGTFTADATALASHILSGKSAYVNGVKVSGSMPEYSGQTLYVANHGNPITVEVDPNDNRMGIVTLPNATGHDGHISGTNKFSAQLWGLIPSAIAAGAAVGQYPGYGTGYMTGTFSADATVEPQLMVVGYTAYKNGAKVIGTLPWINTDGNGYNNMVAKSGNAWASGSGRLHYPIAQGAYFENGSVVGHMMDTPMGYIDDTDYVASNILNTANIFGLQGTALPAKRFASGTVQSSTGTLQFWANGSTTGYRPYYIVNVGGLSFKPSIIFLTYSTHNRTTYRYNRTYPGMDEMVIVDNINYVYVVYKSEGGNSTNVIVNDTGFQLPVPQWNIPYQWEAYE